MRASLAARGCVSVFDQSAGSGHRQTHAPIHKKKNKHHSLLLLLSAAAITSVTPVLSYLSEPARRTRTGVQKTILRATHRLCRPSM